MSNCRNTNWFNRHKFEPQYSQLNPVVYQSIEVDDDGFAETVQKVSYDNKYVGSVCVHCGSTSFTLIHHGGNPYVSR